MKMLWCWRCRAEMPMLDEEEFAAVHVVLRACFDDFKQNRQESNTTLNESFFDRLDRRFAPARKKYEELTGMADCHQNAIYHHRISLYGPPCESCGKVLRTPTASKCWECGLERAPGDWIYARHVPLEGEPLPDFDTAMAEMTAFVTDNSELSGVPVWVFQGEHIAMPGGHYIRAAISEREDRDARRAYDQIRNKNGGLALVCVGKIDGRPVITIEHTDDAVDAMYRMLPTRGLKLSVVQPQRKMRPVRSLVKWWLLRRRARRRGIDFDVSIARPAR